MGEVIVPIFLSLILGILAVLHIAWAFGFKKGFEHSLPTTRQGKKVLNPKPRDSIMVGLVLGLFSVFYVSDFFNSNVDSPLFPVFSWAIPSIFTLRAMGDFKYVGLFKKVKGTAFAKMDSNLAIPLCLLIALLGYYLLFL